MAGCFSKYRKVHTAIHSWTYRNASLSLYNSGSLLMTAIWNILSESFSVLAGWFFFPSQRYTPSVARHIQEDSERWHGHISGETHPADFACAGRANWQHWRLKHVRLYGVETERVNDEDAAPEAVDEQVVRATHRRPSRGWGGRGSGRDDVARAE